MSRADVSNQELEVSAGTCTASLAMSLLLRYKFGIKEK